MKTDTEIDIAYQDFAIEWDFKGMRVMIVDDSSSNRAILVDALKGLDFEITVASSGEEATVLAKEKNPDLILLDIIMGGIDGYETCRLLKADETTVNIPVIFITGMSETDYMLKGFSVGGVDYISKPFHKEEVIARVLTHLKLQKSIKDQEELIKKLEFSSKTDPLTFLLNRRGIREFFDEAKSTFEKDPDCKYSVIIADIDKFKVINDTHGHEAGDQILRQMTDFMKMSVPSDGKICRWGGEEFLFLVNHGVQSAKVIAETFRKKVATSIFFFEQTIIPVTISQGVSELQMMQQISEWIKTADERLYKAKVGGRNSVVAD